MKKNMFRSLAILMMVGAFTVFSFAQDTKERVQLKAGGETKSLTRTIAPNGSVKVSFKANVGQTIGFTAGYDFKDSDIQVFLMRNNEQDTLKSSGPKAPNEYLVDETGDYHVLVRNMTRKNITTTIYLDLFNPEEMTDTDSEVQTETLDFGKADFVDVKRTIPANGTIKFTFNGEKDLIANVRVSDRTNQLTVVFNENQNQKADTTIDLNKNVARKLNRNGEYTIEVINQSAKSVNFGLQIGLEADDSASVNNSSDSGDEIRVRFAGGETSTSVTKEIPANGSVDFIINARKEQKMGYTIGYDFRDSDIEAFLTEPGMQDISKTSGPKEPQEFIVKKSGDHRLTVNNTTKKKVTITLYLDIE